MTCAGSLELSSCHGCGDRICWQHGCHLQAGRVAATVGVLVAWTLSSCGHGCGGSGCAGIAWTSSSCRHGCSDAEIAGEQPTGGSIAARPQTRSKRQSLFKQGRFLHYSFKYLRLRVRGLGLGQGLGLLWRIALKLVVGVGRV